MSTWFSKTTAQVVSELETDQSKGLTTQQAEQRLEKYGPNALESGKKESLVKRFINQLKDPMIIVLLAAAVLSLISTGGEDWVEALIILVIVTPAGSSMPELGEYNIFKVIPYLVVLIGALIGLNVFGVLMAGIVLSVIVGISTGMFPWTDIFNVTFKGISGMYDITVISIIVACIGALVSHGGGIQAIIDFIHARINTKKGAQLGIAALVAGVDIATANNTIAIVMAGPIAKDISDEFGIDPRRTASLLDIFASVVQGILPYGAQLLYAVAGAASMGYTISSVRLLPYLYYPVLMCVCALVFIFFIPDKKSAK